MNNEQDFETRIFLLEEDYLVNAIKKIISLLIDDVDYYLGSLADHLDVEGLENILLALHEVYLNIIRLQQERDYYYEID